MTRSRSGERTFYLVSALLLLGGFASMLLVPAGIWPPRFLVGSFATMLIGFTFGTISALLHWLSSPNYKFARPSKKWFYIGILILFALIGYWGFVVMEATLSSSWQFDLISYGLYTYAVGITYLLAVTVWLRSRSPAH